MNIYIGDLSFSTTEETLKSLFAAFGEVASVKVIKDRFSGKPKGFAFVEMPSNSEADQAIKALNGNRVDGKHIKIKHADSGGKKRINALFVEGAIETKTILIVKGTVSFEF